MSLSLSLLLAFVAQSSVVCQWSAEMNYLNPKDSLGLSSKSLSHEELPPGERVRLHRGSSYECNLSAQRAQLGNTRFSRDYSCKIDETISRLEVSCHLEKSSYVTQVKNEVTHRLFNEKGERLFWIRLQCRCMKTTMGTKKEN